MRLRLALFLLPLVAVVPFAAAATTPKCQKAHTCPAPNHQYVWKGLVCATAAHAIKGVDTTLISFHGGHWRCHRAASYPLHTNIAATTFWVGEIFDGNIADGSQVCSTYDSAWAYHYSGVNDGPAPKGTDCAGAPEGGCDGVSSGPTQCSTQVRTAANGYFPTDMTPKENPFYLDLPFDDINDPTAYAERCKVIPWASQYPASDCTNQNFSYMKNHWVRLIGPNGKSCYGQVEDAGPSHDNLYHDSTYVFGSTNAQPIQGQFNNAGLDVSPALNGCLGFKELDGDQDRVSWQFVDASRVAPGPWKKLVTTQPVDEN